MKRYSLFFGAFVFIIISICISGISASAETLTMPVTRGEITVDRQIYPKRYCYTGTQIKPVVRIKNMSTGRYLLPDKDFTVSYRNNVKIGRASILINGIGNYTGSCTRYFNIVPGNTSIVSLQNKRSGNSSGVQITWKRTSNCSGYSILRNKRYIATLNSASATTYFDKDAKDGNNIYQVVPLKKVNGEYYVNNTSPRKGIFLIKAPPGLSLYCNNDQLKISLRWNASALSSSKIIYQVQKSDSSSFSTKKTYAVTEGKRSKTFSVGTSGDYYLRVRTRYEKSAGTYIYSPWSKTVKVTPEIYVEKKLDYLKKKYPDGKYWAHKGSVYLGAETSEEAGVCDVPCYYPSGRYCASNYYYGKVSLYGNGVANAKQCNGFASLMSDEIFGKNAPLYIKSDINQLRKGDFVRLVNSVHSVLVTDVNHATGEVTVVECNGDYCSCQIWWTRTGRAKTITLDTIRYQRHAIVSRY
ncbi:MAG: hypothetical protein Q4C42_04830 [Clostridia bacterium]|nr:hypothetical protein [Clostridia bacterium]